MEGWLKLHRKIVGNPMWLEEKFDKARAWIDLLILACHKEESVKIRKHMINLKPGELCYSMKTLARRWQWNFRTVSNYLDVLESKRMIHRQIIPVTTIISIVNWSKYQPDTPHFTPKSTYKQEYKNKEVLKIPNFPKC